MTATVPPRLTPVARRAWRRLRTMRTAIILLLVLGAGAGVGSFFPQRPIQMGEVIRWKARNPRWASIAESLGLFDVYGSWWFMAIYGLLLVSLVGCLVPRYRAWVRAIRARPRADAIPSHGGARHAADVAADAGAVLDGAERVLRRRRYRVARAGATLAADKGHWREGGSLVFHTSFLVLLLGVSTANLFGHTGQVAVIEGERFTETRIDYDSITTGRFFTGHRGFTVELDSFDVDWHPNGVPKQFVSHVRVLDGDEEVLATDIFVNTPLTYRGVRLYQISWGWAPEIRITQHGRVLYDGPTVFLQRQGGWNGVVKVPGTEGYQTGFEMLFVADPQRSDDGRFFSGGPRPTDPLIVFEQFVGELGLDRPQSVYALDKTSLAPAEVGAMRMGAPAGLPDGIEVSFTGLRQYSVLQVATNPGALVLLIAAILILVGLLPALYSSRRRIWVRAEARDGVTRLEIAGRATQRKAAFDEEFASLVKDMDRDLYVRIGARDG
jgi:cytochrome c biogenesis protein